MSYFETLTDSMDNMICAINDATSIMDEPLTVEKILHAMNIFDRVQTQLSIVQCTLDEMRMDYALSEARDQAIEALTYYLSQGGTISVNVDELAPTHTILNEWQLAKILTLSV